MVPAPLRGVRATPIRRHIIPQRTTRTLCRSHPLASLRASLREGTYHYIAQLCRAITAGGSGMGECCICSIVQTLHGVYLGGDDYLDLLVACVGRGRVLNRYTTGIADVIGLSSNDL